MEASIQRDASKWKPVSKGMPAAAITSATFKDSSWFSPELQNSLSQLSRPCGALLTGTGLTGLQKPHGLTHSGRGSQGTLGFSFSWKLPFCIKR